MRRPSPFFWSVLAWCLAAGLLDALTKLLANRLLEPQEWVATGPLGAGLLLAYNPGGAFGWLPANPALHEAWRVGSGALCLGALVAVCGYVHGRGARSSAAGWGLLFGGALGNLLEQTLTVHATDFLVLNGDAPLVRVFNVADVALGLGALLVGASLARSVRMRSRALSPQRVRTP